MINTSKCSKRNCGLSGKCGDGISSVQHAKGISEEGEID